MLPNIISYILISLFVAAIICSTINIIQFSMFYSYQNVKVNQFIQTRKPNAIIIYGILSIINSFVLLPIIIATDILKENSTHFAVHIVRFTNNVWILSFIHNSITCLLLFIIAHRSWLLFYDYKYMDAYTNIAWRQMINPNDSKQNKWLKYKKSFGSNKFLLKTSFIIIIPIMILLLTINFVHTISDNFRQIGLYIVVFIAIPLWLFIVWICTIQVREINDQFKIRKELKYLSICIFVCICSFPITIYTYSNIATYISDIIFAYTTVHIQCYWSTRKSIEYRRRSFKSKPSLRRTSSGTMKMLDVLSSESAFKAFIQHCCKELNVENLLFLIEIAQYRAILLKYDVGEKCMANRFIDVVSENVHQLLLEIDPGFIIEEQPATNTLSLNPTSLKHVLSENILIDGAGHGHGHNKQEDRFQAFQDKILSHDWLPCSKDLIPDVEKKPQLIVLNSVVSHSVQSTTNNSHCINISDNVSHEWIYSYALYLYDKYIGINSDLMVNLPSHVHTELRILFSLDINDVCDYIWSMNDKFGQLTVDQQNEILFHRPCHNSLLIKTYLYHVFDTAFKYIWALVRDDCFQRFQTTDAYRSLNIKKSSSRTGTPVHSPLGAQFKATLKLQLSKYYISDLNPDPEIGSPMGSPMGSPRDDEDAMVDMVMLQDYQNMDHI